MKVDALHKLHDRVRLLQIVDVQIDRLRVGRRFGLPAEDRQRSWWWHQRTVWIAYRPIRRLVRDLIFANSAGIFADELVRIGCIFELEIELTVFGDVLEKVSQVSVRLQAVQAADYSGTGECATFRCRPTDEQQQERFENIHFEHV